MKKTYTIRIPFGLQPSPALRIARTARTFPQAVTLEINGKSYDAKSLVHLLSAGAKCGDIVTVSAEDGQAAQTVVEEIGTVLTTVKPPGYSP
ncbi:HPr family phosphocarrier protein [Paenibacillus sp. GCM10027627]|uniref:HPr family phosphocarrier protein n=1 Tax=unclassified Paenibacillus TaxID=185978 RepID=UPI00362FA5F5